MENLAPSTRGCRFAWETDSLSYHSRCCMWFFYQFLSTFHQVLAAIIFLIGILTLSVDWNVESGKLSQHPIAYHGEYDPTKIEEMCTTYFIHRYLPQNPDDAKHACRCLNLRSKERDTDPYYKSLFSVRARPKYS